MALYDVEVLPQGDGELGEVYVRFRDTAGGAMVERSWTLAYDAHAPAFDRASPSMQLAGTAALLAEKLQGGPRAAAIRLAELAPVVNALRGRLRARGAGAGARRDVRADAPHPPGVTKPGIVPPEPRKGPTSNQRISDEWIQNHGILPAHEPASLRSPPFPARLGAPSPGGPTRRACRPGLTPEGGRIVVEAKGMPAPAPLFFAASVEETVSLGTAAVAGEMRLRLHVLQGRPEVLTLGLSGDGEVTDVSGPGLAAWSVRRAAAPSGAGRLLDLRPAADAAGARDFELVLRTRLEKPAVPGTTAVLVATPGEAAGFSSTVELRADPDVDLRVASAAGELALGGFGAPAGPPRFMSTGDGRIEVRLARRGAAVGDVELAGARLSGRLAGGRRERRLHAARRSSS